MFRQSTSSQRRGNTKDDDIKIQPRVIHDVQVVSQSPQQPATTPHKPLTTGSRPGAGVSIRVRKTRDLPEERRDQ